MKWRQLPERDREGMTQEFWESLSKDNREAFSGDRCILGDHKPRAFGSPYCEEHVKENQKVWNPDANR